jgi:DNA gyrase/topoisomerase IV subunit A
LTTRSSLEDWIREIDERPESAPSIIRAIANRLIELEKSNETLQAENIALKIENKVEEYETKITNLEYQIELLSRQVQQAPTPSVEGKELLIFNHNNQVLRETVAEPRGLYSGQIIAYFSEGSTLREKRVYLKSFDSTEEILLIFDTGHVVAIPVSSLPSVPGDEVDWNHAYQEDPDSIEELVNILPISRLPLYEYSVQISRRGFAKRMPAKSFNTYIAQKNIGTGIRQQPDKPFNIILCNAEDTFVIVSKEGYIVSMTVDRLPFAIESIINLGTNDYIVASFVFRENTSLLIVTKDGKIVHRDTSWLTTANSFRTQGQSIFSRKVRERGTQVIAATPIEPGDWGVCLTGNGQIMAFEIEDTLNQGSIQIRNEDSLLAFTLF